MGIPFPLFTTNIGQAQISWKMEDGLSSPNYFDVNAYFYKLPKVGK